MKTVDNIKNSILRTIETCPGYWIVFEGMMISTIKSTFYDFLLGIHREHKHIFPVFVVMNATLDGCINRITNRGTMRPGMNVEMVYDKNKNILRHVQTYDQRFVRYLNVEDLNEEDMLPEFLRLVGDKDLLEQL